jgi:hypothetical protein
MPSNKNLGTPSGSLGASSVASFAEDGDFVTAGTALA